MDLEKAFRAMQMSREWSESVQAACLFANKEFTPELFQAMTKEFLDDLEYNRVTLELKVPVTIGNALFEAVTAYQPPVIEVEIEEPEPEPEEPDILVIEPEPEEEEEADEQSTD